MVKRIVKVILGVILFVCAAFPVIYMNTIYGYFTGIFLAALLILSVLGLRQVGRRMEISSDFRKRECERGRDVKLGLSVRSRSRFLCPLAVANLFISDMFDGIDAMSEVFFTMPPGKDVDFDLGMDMPHIGVYRVGIQNIRIHDMLGFFHRDLPMNGDFQVFVKPRIRSLEEFNEMVLEEAETNQDTRTSVINGMDYVGVREYELGDSMKSIHWKLSAHSREYMVKLLESSRQTEFSVVLDFAALQDTDKEELMCLSDTLIETALSLIDIISKQHTSYSLLYCDRQGMMKRTIPQGREDDLDLIQDFSVITPNPSPSYPDARTILEEEGSRINRSTNVFVCTSRVTDELLQELLKIKRQGRSPELYQVVPAGYNSRQMEKLRSFLRPLDEAGIGHFFMYTTDAGGQM